MRIPVARRACGAVFPDLQCAPRPRRVQDDSLGSPGSPEGLRAFSRSRLPPRTLCQTIAREIPPPFARVPRKIDKLRQPTVLRAIRSSFIQRLDIRFIRRRRSRTCAIARRSRMDFTVRDATHLRTMVTVLCIQVIRKWIARCVLYLLAWFESEVT